MNYDFITIGGATEDISVYTSEGVLINNDDLTMKNLLAFEYGAKINVSKAFSFFGGGASNASVCLARLGFKVASLVCVGSDARADLIIENFKRNKVATELIKKSKKNTGFSFLLIAKDNEHIAFTHRAANEDLRITKNDLQIFKETKAFYISSLQGDWQKTLKQIFSTKNKNITWNPGNVQIKAGLSALAVYLKDTNIFSLNKDEAIELVMSDQKYRNKSNDFLNDNHNLLKIIKSFGVNIVLITDGENGADVFDGNKFYHQNILKQKKIEDTTGVGDAFASTFGAVVFKYSNIEKALKVSIRNTASVVKKKGAQNGLIKLKI